MPAVAAGSGDGGDDDCIKGDNGSGGSDSYDISMAVMRATATATFDGVGGYYGNGDGGGSDDHSNSDSGGGGGGGDGPKFMGTDDNQIIAAVVEATAAAAATAMAAAMDTATTINYKLKRWWR